MKKIAVVEDDALTAQHPDKYPCRITVRMSDGTAAQNELPYPKGHEKNPMTSAEVQDKFRRLFARYGSERSADGVIAAVDGLDRAKDATTLIAAFNRRE